MLAARQLARTDEHPGSASGGSSSCPMPARSWASAGRCWSTDRGLAAQPIVHDAIAGNERAGLPTGLFSGVRSNPNSGNVSDGVTPIAPAIMTASSPWAAAARLMPADHRTDGRAVAPAMDFVWASRPHPT